MLYYVVELYIVIGVSVLMLYGSFINQRKGLIVLTISLLIIGGILSIISERDQSIIEGLLLTCILGGISLLYVKQEESTLEYGMLTALVCVGVIMVLNSRDLLSMYVGLELHSLGLYILGAYRKESSYATEAGIKYYLIGGFSSGLILFGCSLVYGQTGTIDLVNLSYLISIGEVNVLAKVGVGLVVVALMCKIGAAPYHMWIIDVIEGVSMRTSRIYSVVPKLGLLIVILRLTKEISFDLIDNGVMLVSMISMIVSACGALYQRRIKRFLAYSSVGHIGYLLIAVVAGDAQSAILYMGLYMVTAYSVWSIVESNKVVYIEELRGLVLTNPYSGILLGVLLLSMAGVPPLGGFFVKLNVFIAGIESELYGLVTVGLVCTVVSGFNYLRWLKVMVSEQGNKISQKAKEEEGLLKTIVVGGIILFGLA